jgi:uncharacterized protein YkwD
MLRIFTLLAAAMFALAACAPGPVGPPPLGDDGRPVPRVYRISDADLPRIQFRVLDAVNTLRASSGVAPLELNARLSAAAATHSRDMAVQQRPWNFGSDGSSPIDRVRRAGYTGEFRGELISETFESELETLNAWMRERDTRNVLLDPEARDMGLAFHQESNGKLWWTLVTGAPRRTAFGPQG